MSRLRLPLLAAAVAGLIGTTSRAEVVDPGLTGVTQYDGWDDLTAGNFPGYGSFPGSSPWPSPMGSNQPGSGDAGFNKLSGNGYAAGSSIYVGGFSSTPNTLGGTFAVADSTPVAGLETVVFQLEIGEAFGFDLFDDASPTLSYNGGSQALTATPVLVDQIQNGTFTNPVTGQPEPVFINTWLFEWDLSGVVDPIDSFQVSFSAVQHSQIYALRLDQSDTLRLVPEPASLGLMGLGAASVALIYRRRRARALAA